MTQDNNDNLSFTQKLRKENKIITSSQEYEEKKINEENKQEEFILDEEHSYDDELPILIIPNTVLLPYTNMNIHIYYK